MNKLPLPTIDIKNNGTLTKVFIDGKEVEGVVGITFSHSIYQNNHIPVVRLELMADKVHIGTHKVFDLPEIYHPFYVSSGKLVEAGVLTNDQLNELLEKGLL
ncbi:MAG: hypothetical protein HFH52_04585 [Lachnospiraceae bacterium]|nr:hypothetical protein [Lachnospiraceae bacterium]